MTRGEEGDGDEDADGTIEAAVMDRLNRESAARRAAGRAKWHRP